MKTTRNLKIVVFNDQESNEYIKATLTVRKKRDLRNGYRISTDIYVYYVKFEDHQHLYYGLKFKTKECLNFTKWLCEWYGKLTFSNSSDYIDE